jgi:hypothetical protein
VRCSGITSGGARCKLEATYGSYCWSHAPETADERRQRARRGGRTGGNGRPGSSTELQEIKDLLKELTDRVIGKEGADALSPGAGAVAAQLINTQLRAIELERKIREQEELLERLEALERAQQQEGGSKRWGT